MHFQYRDIYYFVYFFAMYILREKNYTLLHTKWFTLRVYVSPDKICVCVYVCVEIRFDSKDDWFSPLGTRNYIIGSYQRHLVFRIKVMYAPNQTDSVYTI